MLAERNSITEASRILANTLHEIRTPIQTIIGTVELISDTNLDKEQTEYIRQIQFSAEVLLDLANNILDFTKIRSNEFRLESIPFDIAQVTEQVVDLVSIEAFNKGVEMVVDISPGTPEFVTGDPVRIQQIMLNLIKNAVKFTNSGYIHVELEYLNGWATFRITDSGIGISKEKQKKIFTDYFQADISTYRKFGGTGLGLSICKSLVSVMDGEIGVNSNPYGGSIFHFTIPLPPSIDGEFNIPSEKLQRKIDFSRTNTRVLLVDESVLAMESMKRKLARFSITEIDTASTASDALGMIEFAQKIGNPYSIVFINLILHLMDGWHLAAEIKHCEKIDKNFRMYLLVPEGQMRKEAKMTLLDWFDGYLYKPVKRKMLRDLLEEFQRTLGESKGGEVIDLTPREGEIAPQKEEEAGLQIASGLKILIAEDHPVNRRLIEAFLRRFGADVYIAEDGEQAIGRIMENRDISLIFMDIFMPKKSGVEATEILRADGYNGVIIACTANNDSRDFQDYMKIGINDILVKPFKREAVREIVEKWRSVIQMPAQQRQPPLAILNSISQSGGGDEIWDFDELRGVVGNDSNFLKTLLDEFKSQTRKLISETEDTIRQTGDAEKIHRLVHTIKGSSAAIYARRLCAAAQNFDEKSKMARSRLAIAKLDMGELKQAAEEFNNHSTLVLRKFLRAKETPRK